MDTDYGKAFRIVRAAFGWSQAEMAERLAISSSALSLIEAGKRKPSVKVIDTLGRVGNIPSALIVLMASDETDADDQSIQALAAALLKMLVSARDKQRPLPLSSQK